MSQLLGDQLPERIERHSGRRIGRCADRRTAQRPSLMPDDRSAVVGLDDINATDGIDADAEASLPDTHQRANVTAVTRNEQDGSLAFRERRHVGNGLLNCTDAPAVEFERQRRADIAFENRKVHECDQGARRTGRVLILPDSAHGADDNLFRPRHQIGEIPLHDHHRRGGCSEAAEHHESDDDTFACQFPGAHCAQVSKRFWQTPC